jgi:type IV pilus assembly protein PilM
MSLQLSSLTRRMNPCLTRQHGLIGVDIGSRVIKVAQVERRGANWVLAAIRVLPLAGNGELTQQTIESGLIGDSLDGFHPTQSGFRGRRAACLLPTEIVEPRSQMLPRVGEGELRSMLLEDFADNDNQSTITDLWSDSDESRTESPLVRVSNCSIPESVAQRCAEDLLSHRLQCEYLDGLPFAMARAVGLVDDDMEWETLAVLDWGHTRPLLTILRNGVPAFTRILRQCGTVNIEQAMEDALGTSPEESARVLSLCSVAKSERAGAGRLAEVLSGVVAPEADRLVVQLRRTIEFLRQQHPELVPARLWMLGGGATIAGIDQYVAEQLELETSVWQLSASRLSPSLRRLRQQPLFAAAIGLSVPG